jgi:ABC-type nitrate/sulfonate/bicarbonate transport system ATPase subunit
MPPTDTAKITSRGPTAELHAPVILTAVTHRYGQIAVLEDLSLHFSPNEVVAIVGPSGCGKSTLLELVCGLQNPENGSIEADEAVLMPQRDLLLPWFTAVDNAALALRISGKPRLEARQIASKYFEDFGLEGFEGAFPSQLSGGMRQRVSFLRTLLAGRNVLCLDEPFGALDALTRISMQEWLANALEHDPRTVLLVSHDVEEAIFLADRIILLSERPARVIADLRIDLRRPRVRTDPEVIALREQALEMLSTGFRSS